MPTSQYVLSQMTVDDGRGNFYTDNYDYTVLGSGGVPTQNIGSGFYDRTERENYGFSHVTTTRGISQAGGTFSQGDGSRVEQFFQNSDFYRKGLLKAEYEEDATGAIIRGSRVTYADPATASPAVRTGSFFPAESQRQTLFFEKTTSDVNAAAPKSKTENRTFDTSGNLRELDDHGDEQSAVDDVKYTMVYTDEPGTHITRPTQIEADGLASGQMLRKRLGSYAPNVGTLQTLTNIVSGGMVPASSTVYNQASAIYNFTYDGYGNLSTSVDPGGHSLKYTYDTQTQAHVARVDDQSFGYFSTAAYDLRFGLIQSSIDVNGQKENYTYDAFGRLTQVFGPDDQGATVPTIAMSYDPTDRPASATTQHKDVQHSGDPIQTVTFIDGLNRVIQTKKDLDRDVNGNGSVTSGMTVSGQVTFDTRGRLAAQGQPVFDTGPASSFVIVAMSKPTTYLYDEIARQTQVIAPDGTPQGIVTTTAYSIVKPTDADNAEDGETWLLTDVRDGNANNTAAVPPPPANTGRRLSYADSRSNKVAVRDYDQIGTATTLTALTSRYSYDPLDELLSVTDAAGNSTTSAYDTVGQLVTLNSPDAGKTEFQFDLAGNLGRSRPPCCGPATSSSRTRTRPTVSAESRIRPRRR